MFASVPADISSGPFLVVLSVLIFVLPLLVLGLASFIWWFKLRRRKAKARQTTFFRITVPQESETEVSAAEQLMAGLYGIGRGGLLQALRLADHLTFEIAAQKNVLNFYVSCPDHLAVLVEKQIHAAYPDAEIEKSEPFDLWEQGGKVAFAYLKLLGRPFYPLRTHEEMKVDPLNGITSAMSKMGEGEEIAVQVLFKPAPHGWAHAGRALLGPSAPSAPIPKGGETGGNGIKAAPRLEGDLQKAMEKKIAKPGFDAAVRLVSVAPTLDTARLNLQNLAGAFTQFENLTLGKRFKLVFPRFCKRQFMEGFIFRAFPALNFDLPKMPPGLFRQTFILNSEELATICHLPGKNVQTPHIRYVKARTAAAPVETPTEGLYLGISQFRGVGSPVHILPDDRRRHTYIIGQTGTGKSELLKFIAVQDIKAGRGIAFIDPHGEAVADILQQVPPERAEDVIYFDPSDTERPMGLNILEAKTEEQKHLIVNSFIALLYKLYDPNRQGIVGPQLERAVRNVMLTAMSEEGATLVEVMRLLTDENFVKSKLPTISDPLVRRYWTDEMAQTSTFHKSEKMGYFVSKFDRFVTEKVMRNIIGQGKSAFSFREVMDGQKILLVNLAKGRLGEENSNFLGLLMVPRILAAAMGRTDIPESERKDFYLYVDEFQNFATTDFAQILSEARKYRLSLIVANQFISQLLEDIRNAVFGNIGTLIAFRVGADDAKYLAAQFEPKILESDLINSPVGQAYIRLLIKGQPSPPFSIATDWPLMRDAPRNMEISQKIRELSRLKYGRERHVVEMEITQRAQL